MIWNFLLGYCGAKCGILFQHANLLAFEIGSQCRGRDKSAGDWFPPLTVHTAFPLQDITHAQNDLQMTCLERFHAQAHPRNVKFRRTTTNPQQAVRRIAALFLYQYHRIYLFGNFIHDKLRCEDWCLIWCSLSLLARPSPPHKRTQPLFHCVWLIVAGMGESPCSATRPKQIVCCESQQIAYWPWAQRITSQKRFISQGIIWSEKKRRWIFMVSNIKNQDLINTFFF